MVEITTARLRLRPWRIDDYETYARWCGDPEIVRHLGNGRPLSRGEAWRHLAYLIGHWELRGYGLWAAELSASGQLVGRVGLQNPEGWPGIEVGWLIDPAFQGQGLATEAGAAALRWGFETLDTPHICSIIHPDNVASRRVAQRLGERFEREAEVNGNFAHLYGVSREAFRAAHVL
jgi:RimJ/RimL family protein N-acetyltransferase